MTINHFGVSGGKDSTALLLWAVKESGYPIESIRATFCDTGNEAPETLAYIQFLSENVHPIETIYPELGFYELAEREKRFPGVRARFCTKHLKLEPTRAHTLKLSGGAVEEHKEGTSEAEEEEIHRFAAAASPWIVAHADSFHCDLGVIGFVLNTDELGIKGLRHAPYLDTEYVVPEIIQNAFTSAKSARFEFGEQGAG